MGRNLRIQPSPTPKGVGISQMTGNKARTDSNLSSNKSSGAPSKKKSRSSRKKKREPPTYSLITAPRPPVYQPKDLQYYASLSGHQLNDKMDNSKLTYLYDKPKGEDFPNTTTKLPSHEDRTFRIRDGESDESLTLRQHLTGPTPKQLEEKAKLMKGVVERYKEAANHKSYRSYVRTQIGPSVQADAGDSEYGDDTSEPQQPDPAHQPLPRREFDTFNVAVKNLINKVHQNRTEVRDPCDCNVYGEEEDLKPDVVNNSLLSHTIGLGPLQKKKTEVEIRAAAAAKKNKNTTQKKKKEKREPAHFYSNLGNNPDEYDVNSFLVEPKVENWKNVNWEGPSENVKRDVSAEQSLDLTLDPGKKPRTPLPSGRPLASLTDHRSKPEPEPKSKSKPEKKKDTRQRPKPQQSTENGVSVEPNQATMQSRPMTGLSISPRPAGQKRKSTDQPSSSVDKKQKTMPSSHSPLTHEALTQLDNQNATLAQAAPVEPVGYPLSTPTMSLITDPEPWEHDATGGPVFQVGAASPGDAPRPGFLDNYKPGNLDYFGLVPNQYLDDKTPTPAGKRPRGLPPKGSKLPSWPWVLWTILANTPHSFPLPLGVLEFTAYEWIPALPQKNQTVRAALTGPKGGGNFISVNDLWRIRGIDEEVVKRPGGTKGSNCPKNSCSVKVKNGELEHPSAGDPENPEDPKYLEDSKMS
ncbi:hypothetical protein IFR05_008516 [Cadophora sp. M221]|nr:hypothetical protein IFR05_008516 [Cadophora sp. M221]